MGEILDNQEVTTQTLNNIAIDLGATTFSAFSGEKFGVDKLNDITKALVGKGITQGANKCEPYISGGDLYINTGTIIFLSGAKMRITSPLKVEIQNGTYIYALNSTDTNMAEIVVSETAPTTGDYVKLAAVDASGGLTDLREWAQSNVLLASNQSVTKTIVLPQTANTSDTYTETIILPWTGWTKLIYPYKNTYYSINFKVALDCPANFDGNLGRNSDGRIYYDYDEDKSVECHVKRNGENIIFTFGLHNMNLASTSEQERTFIFTFI